MVATEQLNPEDEAVVRRVVAEEELTGVEYDEMVRKLSAMIVGKVEAQADDMPADASA